MEKTKNTKVQTNLYVLSNQCLTYHFNEKPFAKLTISFKMTVYGMVQFDQSLRFNENFKLDWKPVTLRSLTATHSYLIDTWKKHPA